MTGVPAKANKFPHVQPCHMGDREHGAKAALLRSMEGIAGHLREGDYRACFRMSADLTRFAYLLDHKRWVFASEVLESVYGNMEHMSRHLEMPKEAETAIRAKLVRGTDDLLQAIEDDDEAKMWNALQQIRFDATKFHLGGFATYAPKRSVSK